MTRYEEEDTRYATRYEEEDTCYVTRLPMQLVKYDSLLSDWMFFFCYNYIKDCG